MRSTEKTYGANKYETSLICYALACLRRPEQRIRLYEVLEGNLKELPEASLRVIRKMGGIDVVRTGMTLEKRNYQENKSLRSPLYIYNLLRRLGDKHCALCGCEIPEIIQGAHVWPVSKIKKAPGLTPEQRLEYALDGENGLWLCENHHKLFDENLLSFDQDGSVRLREGLDERYANYIQEITKIQSLPQSMLTKRFCGIWSRGVCRFHRGFYPGACTCNLMGHAACQKGTEPAGRGEASACRLLL